MTTIAFLGLGAMGSRMAGHLIDAGHELTVWNRNPERARDLVLRGARLASNPVDAAHGSEVVLSMLRDDNASREVWDSTEMGVVAGLQPGSLAVEMSTLTPARMHELGLKVQQAGSAFIDAPLAGSRPQADAGQLIFFAGGDAETLERARPVLLAMGGAVHHAGPVGAGASVKLMVNALFGAQVAMLAEMLALGERLGVNRATASAILGETPVMGPAAKGAAASMIARAFAPMFPIDLVEKDLGYVETVASQVGALTPIAAALRGLFAEAKATGLSEANITAIIEHFGQRP